MSAGQDPARAAELERRYRRACCAATRPATAAYQEEMLSRSPVGASVLGAPPDAQFRGAAAVMIGWLAVVLLMLAGGGPPRRWRTSRSCWTWPFAEPDHAADR